MIRERFSLIILTQGRKPGRKSKVKGAVQLRKRKLEETALARAEAGKNIKNAATKVDL